MSDGRKVSRRSFLKGAAAAGAAGVVGPMILPSGVLAAHGRPGANDKVALAQIGCGRRSNQLLCIPPDAQFVAFADLFQERLDFRAEQYPDADLYLDYREMLERDDIDGVIIASPDHWHALHAVHACRAGKDVYVEKPMTLTIAEGRKMVKVARWHKRVVQCGSQQRSRPSSAKGCQLVREGRVGKIHTVHGFNYPSPWECTLGAEPVPEGLNWDMWCGQTEPRPFNMELYLPRVRGHEAGWISYRPYSGGEMTGWGAHGLDMIQLALGFEDTGPVEVWPELEKVPPDDGIHKGPCCEVAFRYADGTILRLDGQGPGGGAIFQGETGEIVVNRGAYMVVEPDKQGNMTQTAFEEDGFKSTEAHIKNWVDCMRTREKPRADVEIAHRSTILCHLGNIARWTGRKLQWNPKKERFVDDDDANSYLKRKMRKPYTM